MKPPPHRNCGAVLFMKKISAEIRFWKYVKKTKGCWFWIGGKKESGYGSLWLKNSYLYAHRFSYQIHNGKIPKGMQVCHSCDITYCVNPKHLFLGTQKDNNQDMWKKGRGKIVHHIGEKHGMSKLKETDIKEMRRLYKTGIYSYKELGKKFDTHFSNVCLIINRKHWNSIE